MERRIFPGAPVEAVPRAVALGYFDGVHIGHRAVLQCARDQAADHRARMAVFTFDTLPKMADTGRITDPEETAALLSALGAQEVFEGRFEALREMSPEDFVRKVLGEALGAVAVCCGDNYRFGKDGAGDAAALKALGGQYGIAVTVVPGVWADGEPVSATRIRRALSAGDMETVNRLLGRSYVFTAPVESGKKLGRRLGTPTINQPLDAALTLPRFGVYLSAVEVAGRSYYGVTNIGVKPTVGGERPLSETWIPDFSGDLYGQTVPVRPVRLLREERAFPTLTALGEQITADGETARRMVAPGSGRRAVLFDFDDTLQERREAFLAFSRAFVKRAFPDRSPERQEADALAMSELNGNGYMPYPEFVRRMIDLLHDTASPEEVLYTIQRMFPLYVSLLPGVAEGLSALRAAGYMTGVITNGNPLMQNKKLDVSGLRPLLDLAMVSGDEGVHKPDPELFCRAAARLGLSPKDCIYVGDHPVNDIEGALGAGMKAVFMDACSSFPAPAGVPRVTSMRELTEKLISGEI